MYITHFCSSICVFLWLSQSVCFFPSFLLPVVIMSSSDRLRWIALEIHNGRAAFVSFSYNQTSNSEKVKFTLLSGYSNDSTCRPCVMAALSAVQVAMACSIVCDKEHKSKSTGQTVVDFWIKQVPCSSASTTPGNPAVDRVVASGSGGGSPVVDECSRPTLEMSAGDGVVAAGSGSDSPVVHECPRPTQGRLAVAIGNRVKIVTRFRRGAVGTVKVCSASFAALQLDDGTFVLQVSRSTLERQVSVGDRVCILAGTFRHSVGTAKVCSSQGVAVELDDGQFIPCISASMLALLGAAESKGGCEAA